MIDMYVASNSSASGVGKFEVCMSDGVFNIRKIFGVQNIVYFYKDSDYFYIRSVGGYWSRNSTRLTINEINNYAYKDVTDEVSVSSLTEIPVS